MLTAGAVNADQAVAVLYDTHYGPLTRLAALLASDEAVAEEIVQDAFVAMHGAWRQLRDSDRALRQADSRPPRARDRPWWRRCARFRRRSVKPWCSAITRTCPKPGSPR